MKSEKEVRILLGRKEWFAAKSWIESWMPGKIYCDGYIDAIKDVLDEGESP